MTRTGANRAAYAAAHADTDPRPSRFADGTGEATYSTWAARADAWAAQPKPAPIIWRDFDGTEHTSGSPKLEARFDSFDARANRALRGTMTGESMATWGPRYIREARAVLAMGQRPGQLWQRVAESANRARLIPSEFPGVLRIAGRPGWRIYNTGRSDFPVGYDHDDDGREYGEVATLAEAMREIRRDDAGVTA